MTDHAVVSKQEYTRGVRPKTTGQLGVARELIDSVKVIVPEGMAGTMGMGFSSGKYNDFYSKELESQQRSFLNLSRKSSKSPSASQCEITMDGRNRSGNLRATKRSSSLRHVDPNQTKTVKFASHESRTILETDSPSNQDFAFEHSAEVARESSSQMFARKSSEGEVIS